MGAGRVRSEKAAFINREVGRVAPCTPFPQRPPFGARGTTCLLPPAAAHLAVTEAPLTVAAQCFGDPDLGPTTAAYGADGLLSLSVELVHQRGGCGNGGVIWGFRLQFTGLLPPSRIEWESTV